MATSKIPATQYGYIPYTSSGSPAAPFTQTFTQPSYFSMSGTSYNSTTDNRDNIIKILSIVLNPTKYSIKKTRGWDDITITNLENNANIILHKEFCKTALELWGTNWLVELLTKYLTTERAVAREL